MTQAETTTTTKFNYHYYVMALVVGLAVALSALVEQTRYTLLDVRSSSKLQGVHSGEADSPRFSHSSSAQLSLR